MRNFLLSKFILFFFAIVEIFGIFRKIFIFTKILSGNDEFRDQGRRRHSSRGGHNEENDLHFLINDQ